MLFGGPIRPFYAAAAPPTAYFDIRADVLFLWVFVAKQFVQLEGMGKGRFNGPPVTPKVTQHSTTASGVQSGTGWMSGIADEIGRGTAWVSALPCGRLQ
jgi:hypothetical protein